MDTVGRVTNRCDKVTRLLTKVKKKRMKVGRKNGMKQWME